MERERGLQVTRKLIMWGGRSARSAVRNSASGIVCEHFISGVIMMQKGNKCERAGGWKNSKEKLRFASNSSL